MAPSVFEGLRMSDKQSCSRVCFNCKHYYYHATYQEDSCSRGVVEGRDAYLDGHADCPQFSQEGAQVGEESYQTPAERGEKDCGHE